MPNQPDGIYCLDNRPNSPPFSIVIHYLGYSQTGYIHSNKENIWHAAERAVNWLLDHKRRSREEASQEAGTLFEM